eukprot:2797856-Amphidinium_carterae.3
MSGTRHKHACSKVFLQIALARASQRPRTCPLQSLSAMVKHGKAPKSKAFNGLGVAPPVVEKNQKKQKVAGQCVCAICEASSKDLV